MKRNARIGKIVHCLMILTLGMVLATGVFAQEVKFPTKPVTLIVPVAAGGGVDIVARLVAGFWEKKLGQPIGVVNKAGAGGAIGFREAAKSEPDGYKVGVLNVPDSPIVVASKGAKAGYRNDDFILLGAFTRSPFVVATMNSTPLKNFQEFVSYVKKNPGKVGFGLGGESHRLAIYAIEAALGIDVNPTMFKSAGENLNALMGGHLMVGMLASSFIVAGKDKGLIGLVSTADKRLERLPEVPTFKELGYDVQFDISRVFVVPRGTPEPIVRKLSETLAELNKDSDFVAKVNSVGEEYHPMPGPEVRKYYAETCTKVDAIVAKHKEEFAD
jgi:tripartite-type tricarboxylate transporter receptor subunit TctC